MTIQQIAVKYYCVTMNAYRWFTQQTQCDIANQGRFIQASI